MGILSGTNIMSQPKWHTFYSLFDQNVHDRKLHAWMMPRSEQPFSRLQWSHVIWRWNKNWMKIGWYLERVHKTGGSFFQNQWSRNFCLKSFFFLKKVQYAFDDYVFFANFSNL